MKDTFDQYKWFKNQYLNENEDFENESKNTFNIEDMKEAYEHAMWALADTGHGEGFEEYMKNKFNITI